MEKDFIEPENRGAFSAIDPIKILLKFLRFWPYIALSVVVALVIGYFINKTTPPVYQTQGKFFIRQETNESGILDLTGLTKVSGSSMTQRMANEAVFIKSRPVAEKAINKLDLDVDYYQEGRFTDLELYKDSPIHVQVDWNHPQLVGGKVKVSWIDKESFTVSYPDANYVKVLEGSGSEQVELAEERVDKFKFGEFVDLPFLRIKVTLLKNNPSGEILIALRPFSSLVGRYTGEDLQVFSVNIEGSILGLSLNTTHPEKGADYLNALMEVYLAMELEEKNRMARNTVDFIDSQISGVSDSLRYFESNLQSFRSTNRTFNVDVESNKVFDQVTQLESELSQERFNKDYYENLRDYLVRENYDQILAPAGLGINDPTLNSLINSLISQQNERMSLLNTQTEASPRVKDVTRKIQDTKNSLFEVLRNLSNNSQFKIGDLESRISKIENQFFRLPSTEQNLIRIERGRNLNETIYNFLMQRRAEAAISMASNYASNKIVEYAEANYEAINVRKTGVYLISLFLGFVIPIGIIGVISLLDNRIKDAKELEESLAFPLLAKIPKNKASNELIVLEEPRSATAEAFRSLKTNMSFVIPADKQITIAVSSTLSGEGKTFTAINIASIYSMNSKRTVLVSCDMFKPSSLKGFKLKSKVGLSNYLSEQVDSLPEIIQRTEYPNFDIITAGAIPPNPSDLLASGRFVNLLEELKAIYDVVVLDTPPVGLISQSFEVVKHVNVILYVLRYNFSEKSFIEEINSIRKKKKLTNVYAVLNDVAAKELTYKGYNYGYYEEKKNKKSGIGRIFGRKTAAM